MAQENQNPGFIHNVFFWLKETTTDAERAAFLNDLKGLAEMKTVQSLWVGPPAGTPRAIVDNSYDFALVVHLKNSEDHDVYQIDPIHKAFGATHSNLWDKVQIFDLLTE